MEEDQRPQSVGFADSFDDLFKSVADVKKEAEDVVVKEEETTVTPQETKKEEVEEVKEPTEYKKRLDQLIEDNILENVSIEIPDEKGETQLVFLSDLSDLDEATYKTILANYKDAKDNEIKEKYISTEGLDETTKKLIEIRRAGGNIDNIVKENVSAIDQWLDTKQNLTDNEQLQMNVVAWELKNKGLSDRVIDAQIKDYVDNLQLDVEAEKIVDLHLSAHQGEIEIKKQQELQRLEDERENQKQVKKNLSGIVKSWNLPDNLQKVIIDNSTKVDADNLTNTEKLFFNSITTAEGLAEVAFFLNNREEYKKWVSSKPVLNAKLDGNVKPYFKVDLKQTRQVKREAITADEKFDELFNK